MNLPALNKAQQNILAIESTVKEIFVNFLKLGLLLYDCRKNAYYNEAGFDTFKDFVQAVNLEWTQATRLVGIAELVLTQRIDSETVMEIGYSKMCYLLPRFRKEEVDGDLIELAKVAPQADLRKELGYKISEDDEGYIVCPTCGAEIQFYKNMIRRR